MKILKMLIIISIIFVSCSKDSCVTGNNNYIIKEVELGEFENITNPLSGTVVLKKGNNKVVANVEENIIDRLKINVEGSTLIFGELGGKCFNSHGIDFEIFSLNYEKLTNNGSANWTSDFLEFDPEIVSNGSGDIKLTGSSNTQNITSSGSGNIDLSNMPTNKVFIENHSSGKIYTQAKDYAEVIINGSGDVVIDSMSGVLNIEINGSGNLIYSGNTDEINFTSNGSGQVIKK